MNTNNNTITEDDTIRCVICGIGEIDDIELDKCFACKQAGFCSVECNDKVLFQQPEHSHLGDCPICCLPLPLDQTKSILKTCCCKVICAGCDIANVKRELEGKLQERCPFCQLPTPKNDDENELNLIRRVKANDPFAMCHMGWRCSNEGDSKSAFQHWMRAAKLGDPEARFHLSCLYESGFSLEVGRNDEKDIFGSYAEKQVYHLEKAAIGGHAAARYNLACIESDVGREERAVKHWIIGAKLGCDSSLDRVKECYRIGLVSRKGLVSKEDFAAALRGHQAAVDATKSYQRKFAEVARQKAKTAGKVWYKADE